MLTPQLEYIHLLVPRGYYPPARRRNVRQDEATEEMEQSAVAGTRFIPESGLENVGFWLVKITLCRVC